VAGAADFATGLESQVWQTLPAAYVIPLEDEATPNDEQNALRQTVTERIGVVVEFDNSQDRRGQGVTLSYEAMRTALFAALLNWHPDPDAASVNGLEYAGGHLIQFDRARLFFQWEFSRDITIDETDGFQVGSVPLLEIDGNDDPGNPPFPIHVELPQPAQE
jgi:hypothetical protein